MASRTWDGRNLESAGSCLLWVVGRGQLTGLLAAVHAQHPNPRPLTASLAAHPGGTPSAATGAPAREPSGSELVRIRFAGTVVDPARYAGGA